jgi:hypothetical protein
MRLRSTYASLLLSCLVVGGVAASPSAQVYFYPPNPNLHHSPPELNPTEANVLISHHLGIPVHESLGDLALEWWNTIARGVLGPGATEIGKGVETSMLMVVESDHPEGEYFPTRML